MRKCSFCGAEINDIKHKKYKDICVDECSKNSLFEQLDDSIEICPSCKVVSADLSKYSDIHELGRIQKEKLDGNTDYQNVANDNNLDKLEQKLILLKIEQENYIDTGYPIWNLYTALFLYYHTKGIDEKALVYANKMLDFANYFIKSGKERFKSDIMTQKIIDGCLDDILYVIDVFRQLNKFDIANKYANILKSYKFTRYTRYEKRWFKLECKKLKQNSNERILRPKIKNSTYGIII